MNEATVKWAKESTEWVDADDALCAKAAMREYGVKTSWIEPSFRAEVRAAMKEGIWDPWAAEVGSPAPEILQSIETFHEEYIKSH